jgi:predicted nucleotidyltransferase
MNSYLYPKNKEHFKKLIPLVKKIIRSLRENKINPIIYGSFAHFYHTKDEKMSVNDIDLLVQEKYISNALEALRKHKIKFKPYPYGVIVKKGKLKVEVDKMDKEYNSAKKNSFFQNVKKIDFYGINVQIISLKQLEGIYKAANTKEDKLKMGNKIKHLETFLGRKLK